MLADIHLQNFRSYIDDSFEFSGGVNIIVGPNASGKTNLLEAILMLTKGSSYRAKDNEMVRFGQDWSRLDTRLTNSTNRTVKITPTDPKNKKYIIDGKAYSRLGPTHKMPVVLFEPNHLQLLSGSPEKRREYLDDLLEHIHPGFERLRRQYIRTLTQRNFFLKKNYTNKDAQIFPWNLKLSELAGQITRARIQATERLNIDFDPIYKKLSNSKTNVLLVYNNTWPIDSYESNMLKTLENSFELDKIKGFTSAGPHREDLSVMFDNHQAQSVASRGEIRTAVLALKTTELSILQSEKDTNIPFLLDDVFSELDGRRRHALSDYLSKYQIFITTTDADLVLQNFAKNCNIIPLT